MPDLFFLMSILLLNETLELYARWQLAAALSKVDDESSGPFYLEPEAHIAEKFWDAAQIMQEREKREGAGLKGILLDPMIKFYG